MPYSVVGPNSIYHSRKVEFVIGIFSELKVGNNSFASCRFSFSKRTPEVLQSCGIAYCSPSKLQHNDLNVDLTYFRRLNKIVDFGLGGSFVRKLNSTLTVANYSNSGDEKIFNQDHLQFGVNTSFVLNISVIRVRISYLRKIFKQKTNPSTNFNGKNRYAFTILSNKDLRVFPWDKILRILNFIYHVLAKEGSPVSRQSAEFV